MHDPDPFSVKEAANEAVDTGTANGEAVNSEGLVDSEHELQQAIQRADQTYDQFLRAKADAENIRRRGQEEVAKAYKFAIESFAEDLVPVVDSLEKALQAQDATPEAMREGIELTLRQLKAAFAKGNLKEIDPVGEKFDPHFHQAISMVPGQGVAPNHVVAVLQKGWLIADRVLRPALVTVAQA
ncbi:MAG TPA: nucleotide exchange factor GrpE [Burkholderiaceae bacterium]|nr:nucleotide exchange factor GrpE [Burkholderiaceae bacterium]